MSSFLGEPGLVSAFLEDRFSGDSLDFVSELLSVLDFSSLFGSDISVWNIDFKSYLDLGNLTLNCPVDTDMG